ncbi:cytochrome c3 family protein, partial [Bdellovibrionota bacterium]
MCHEEYYESENIFQHYPSGVGLCNLCHNAHRQHLEEGDPDSVTTDKSAESCYRCHNRKDLKTPVHAVLEQDENSCIRCHN